MKGLVQKLGLGVLRRRSSNVFSFSKVLENGLKDELKLKENCLKFSKYACVYTYTHIERKKGEREF